MEKETIKNVVIIGLVIYILFGFFGTKSQMITLYKHDVMEGQSMISFVNHDDPNGTLAKDHCERLKKLYEEEDKIEYVCSDVQYNKYKSKIK